ALEALAPLGLHPEPPGVLLDEGLGEPGDGGRPEILAASGLPGWVRTLHPALVGTPEGPGDRGAIGRTDRKPRGEECLDVGRLAEPEPEVEWSDGRRGTGRAFDR